MKKIKTAIIGPGNIGQDLMIKMSRSPYLELACVIGIVESQGMQRARAMGADASIQGVDYLASKHPDVQIVFDATSAKAHEAASPKLQQAGFFCLDLTPAAIGPYCVPAVNLDESMLDLPEVNMVTCAGQATTPIVAAINGVADVYYAETISSLGSKSAGPGTRANIDEFTVTTRNALMKIGGAENAKAIIILNPAEPPIYMSNTIYTRVRKVDLPAISAAVEEMGERIRKYVPGYRFKMQPILKDNNDDIIMTIVEVEGLGDYLPVYAGNLDIINTAAIETAEAKARKLLGEQA